MKIRWLRRKEVWRLTWVGRLAALVLLLIALRLLAPLLYRGLAAGRPLSEPDFIVFEGWLRDADLLDALAAVATFNATPIWATGGPIESGGVLSQHEDYATFTAARLEALGVAPERLLAAPAPATRRDRTYNAALALGRHLQERGVTGGRLNLVTRGTHARRSALLYRRALGPGFEIGVLVLPDEFGAGDWWKTSNGFRNVLYEWLAWSYTQIFRLLPGEAHL